VALARHALEAAAIATRDLTFLPAAGDERPGAVHNRVDARELDAAYVIIRDADERLQMITAAARLLERNGEYMLDLLREAQWLLGDCQGTAGVVTVGVAMSDVGQIRIDEWRARRDAFMSVKLPAQSR